MVAHLEKIRLLDSAEIVAPPSPRCCQDRNFELPPALLLGVFGLFLAYLGVMSLGFMEPSLVPMVVNVIFVAAFAFVPAKWATMKPDKADRAKTWAEFREHGIATASGHAGGGEAAVLVLLLPALIFCWGVAAVSIAAFA